MTRGLLTSLQLESIAATLPDVVSLQKRAFALSPDGLSMVCTPKSDFPVAAVCLQDAAQTLGDVRLAFHEYHAHRVFYREVKSPPQVLQAISMERYYLDDAAFRLYNAGEDIAGAIFFMLELKAPDLALHKKRPSSMQATIRQYLALELPDHLLAKAVEALAQSKDWRAAIWYRGECVHQQSPLVLGQGISYRRRNRWRSNDDGSATLVIDGGDKPDLTTTGIFDFLMPAFTELLGVVESCLQWYEVAMKEPRGGSWRFKGSL